MSHTHHSVFDYIARDDDAPAVAGRKALALASKRVEDRFGNFLARTAGDSVARLELIRDDFDAVVAAACEEIGYTDVGSLTRTIWNDRISRISGENPFAKKDEDEDDEEDEDKKDDKTSRTASTHEARKPKLCPYHDEVMNISLAQGEPQAGYNAMASHAWSAKHCKGDEYDGGRCNFKPEMTTQSYWDAKAEKAEQRRQERQEQMQEQPVNEVTDMGEPENPEEPVNDPVEDNVVELPVAEGGEAEVDAGLPADELMSVAASTKRFVPLVPKTAYGNPGDGYGGLEDELGSQAFVSCPACGDDGPIHLGDLGSRSHYRCRQCGMDFNDVHGDTGDPHMAAQKKHLEGDKVTDKRQRQYEHIKKSCLEDGKSEEECKELAARTVNKQRAEKGETKDSAHTAEALERQDVTQDTHLELNRSNERPSEPPDTEMPGSPHPTKREDIQPDITVPRQKVQNDDPEDIGEDVTERQDVTQESEFSNKYPNRWASADEAIANFNRS